jgi:hypothetical protein
VVQQCCGKQSSEFSCTVACSLLQRFVTSKREERELLGFSSKIVGLLLASSSSSLQYNTKSLMESFRVSEAKESSNGIVSGPNGVVSFLYERNYLFPVPSPE